MLHNDVDTGPRNGLLDRVINFVCANAQTNCQTNKETIIALGKNIMTAIFCFSKLW